MTGCRYLKIPKTNLNPNLIQLSVFTSNQINDMNIWQGFLPYSSHATNIDTEI